MTDSHPARAQNLAHDPPAGTLATLIRDRPVAWALFAAVFLALPIGPQELRMALSSQVVDLLAVPLVMVFVAVALARNPARERRFWGLWLGGLSCWVVVRTVIAGAPAAWKGPVFDVTVDCLYVIFYLCVFLATTVRPDGARNAMLDRSRPSLATVGATFLAFVLLLYFVVLPAQLRPEEYGTWQPSMYFYVTLDLVLVGRFVQLYFAATQRRWRAIYLLLAATCTLWAIADFVESLVVGGIVDLPPGGPADLIWNLPLVVLIAASRLRPSAPADRDAAELRSTATQLSPAGSFLVLMAIALPVAHLTLHSTGLLDRALQGPREAVALIATVLLASLATIEHGRIRRAADRAESRRQDTEQRLLERTAHLDALIEHSPLGIVSLDPGMRVRIANPAFERLFGFRRDKMAGKTLDRFLAGDEQIEEMREIGRRVLQGEAVHRYARRRRDNGREVDIELHCASYVIDGQVAGILALYRDRTDEIRAEGQLRQAQKMEAIGSLAGGVAHDFNNLLTVILGRSALLYGAQTDPELRNHVAEIQNAGELAASMTRQLLLFARKQTVRAERIDLNTVAAHSTETVLRRLLREDVTLQLDLAPEVAPIAADRAQVEQLILNLALNAQDAMPRGGTLRIATADVRFERTRTAFGLRVSAGEYVGLSVRDTGVGIPPELLPRIFDPFFTTKEEGTGLGLATVYGVVEQIGGLVDVESHPGTGTAFRIYLPVNRQIAPAEGETARDDDMPLPELGRDRVVLVVEDVPEIGTMLGRFLEREGYCVLHADRPSRALELARGFDGAIDLLLTDVVMPEMDGVQLAEQVRALRPEVKVLYMSGYADDHFRSEVALEPSTFLAKPFALTELSRRLHGLFAAAR